MHSQRKQKEKKRKNAGFWFIKDNQLYDFFSDYDDDKYREAENEIIFFFGSKLISHSKHTYTQIR